MQVRMRKNLVAVKKLGKPTSSKSQLDGLIHMPDVANNQGIVRFIGPQVEGLEPDQKVFYGNKMTPIRMNGEDILIMEEDNVYAVVEEAQNEEASKE